MCFAEAESMADSGFDFGFGFCLCVLGKERGRVWFCDFVPPESLLNECVKRVGRVTCQMS